MTWVRDINVFSTCRDCGTLMKVVDTREHSHPTCATVQDKLDGLADAWLAQFEKGQDEQLKFTEELMEREQARRPEMRTAAVQYASWGWPVFPLAFQSKVPAIPKRKGGNGFKDATNDVERVQRWWSKHPDHNIGLATGSAFDVIDIDTKDSDGNPNPRGPLEFLKALRDKVIHHDVHAVAVTASGGMHLYILPRNRKNYAGVRPGIDYRGIGGYVVAPPSRLELPGRTYTWLVEPSPIIKGDKDNG